MDVLHAIGSTSLVRLRKLVPPECADSYGRLEWEPPPAA
jgi:cysteine synthase